MKQTWTILLRAHLMQNEYYMIEENTRSIYFTCIAFTQTKAEMEILCLIYPDKTDNLDISSGVIYYMQTSRPFFIHVPLSMFKF